MKFGIVVFPGSNCDEDLYHVYKNILHQDVTRLWHKEHDLQSCDLILVPGGFSYGDYLRSGAIARFSPIMNEVIAHAEKGGYVLGICNGFQVLTEAGLLPGTLLKNREQKFICKNAYIRPVSKTAVMTAKLDHNQAYKIPVAHADGRFYAPDEVIHQIFDNDQVLFQYSDPEGSIDENSNFNGSVHNIAGVCNEGKNVFGLMPHPERASDMALGNEDGRVLLEAFLDKTIA